MGRKAGSLCHFAAFLRTGGAGLGAAHAGRMLGMLAALGFANSTKLGCEFGVLRQIGSILRGQGKQAVAYHGQFS